MMRMIPALAAIAAAIAAGNAPQAMIDMENTKGGSKRHAWNKPSGVPQARRTARKRRNKLRRGQ